MFLAICAIVLTLSAVVAFRRSRLLSRERYGRFMAIWPSIFTVAVAWMLMGADHGKPELGPSLTTHLYLLIGAFGVGWFAGVMAEVQFNRTISQPGVQCKFSLT